MIVVDDPRYGTGAAAPDPPHPGAVGNGSLASAAPRRQAGTRTRAGNAMARTRAGLLDGARRALVAGGVRGSTMADIANHAGVAKATLYNHFRTKRDVWEALLGEELHHLAAECAGMPSARALGHAATRISTHPVLRAVAGHDPQVPARMLAADRGDGHWPTAGALLRRWLDQQGAVAGAAGEAEVAAAGSVILRWLASFLTDPAPPDSIAGEAETLARLLPSRCPVS